MQTDTNNHLEYGLRMPGELPQPPVQDPINPPQNPDVPAQEPDPDLPSQI